jgi:hypothetical protein
MHFLFREDLDLQKNKGGREFLYTPCSVSSLTLYLTMVHAMANDESIIYKSTEFIWTSLAFPVLEKYGDPTLQN